MSLLLLLGGLLSLKLEIWRDYVVFMLNPRYASYWNAFFV